MDIDSTEDTGIGVMISGSSRKSDLSAVCFSSLVKKVFYYRGLAEWDNEKGWLTDTCLDGQDTFKKLLAMFDIRTE